MIRILRKPLPPSPTPPTVSFPLLPYQWIRSSRIEVARAARGHEQQYQRPTAVKYSGTHSDARQEKTAHAGGVDSSRAEHAGLCDSDGTGAFRWVRFISFR